MCAWVRYAPVIGCIDQLCKFGFVYMSTYSIDNVCVCVCVFAQTLMNAKQAWQIVVYLRLSVWTQQVDICANARLDSVEMVTTVWVWQNIYTFIYNRFKNIQ